MSADLDALSRKYTCDHTFSAFVAGVRADPCGYTPTLCTTPRSRRARDVREAAELAALADAFDAAMQEAGDPRRAWRGTVAGKAALR